MTPKNTDVDLVLVSDSIVKCAASIDHDTKTSKTIDSKPVVARVFWAQVFLAHVFHCTCCGRPAVVRSAAAISAPILVLSPFWSSIAIVDKQEFDVFALNKHVNNDDEETIAPDDESYICNVCDGDYDHVSRAFPAQVHPRGDTPHSNKFPNQIKIKGEICEDGCRALLQHLTHTRKLSPMLF